MDVNVEPIVSTERYKKDKEKLLTTGSKRAKQIWGLIFMLFFPPLWPVLPVLLSRYFRKASRESKERVSIIEEFVRLNNYTFENNSGKWATIDKTLKSYNLPFDVDHLVHAHQIKGVFMGCNFSYNMSSVFVKTPRGPSQFPYNIFTIDLPVTLPKIFINSKHNNMAGLDAGAVNFEAWQDHVLEGDFPTYYDVRIEKNEQIDMYQILTPEVMDTLKRNNYYDVWLNNNQLVLLTFADQDRYFAGIPSVFENAGVLMKEIDKIARAIR